MKAKLSDWDKPTAERFLKEYRIDTAVFILREFGLKERDAYLRELGPANAENPLEAVGQTAAGLFRYTAGFAAREMRTAVKRVVDIIGVEVEEAKRGPQP